MRVTNSKPKWELKDPYSSSTEDGQSVAPADQLDFVAVGIDDEGDDRGSTLHRTGLADHRSTKTLDLSAGHIDVVDFDGDMAETTAKIVVIDAPVVGQLDDRGLAFLAVAD